MQLKIQKSIQDFEQYNSRDPNIIVINKIAYPTELFMAKELNRITLELNSSPSTPLLLASHCQHIGRWEIKRELFSNDKIGYITWRNKLKIHHAEVSKKILGNNNIPEEIINKTIEIILKQKIKLNEDTQTIENALCISFLLYQSEQLINTQGEDKSIQIFKKTLKKMDENGINLALKYTLPDTAIAIIRKITSNS
ncbi:DUF4202 domain-containing protein [Aquitalea sp. LB_tupeE]|uniref:DUF4202 domain-containing protein n=1 Tax=Aquitalea sp. LB_tupeE TaxID=2748078 RepID=UPI0015B958E9|nr:DUF4202 domain-containing protein [Aquitalea sp. LB_tupeE]NWK78814.1 DUF4202 domain-containing protein [Aquitalea sp. LB_tupeE]